MLKIHGFCGAKFWTSLKTVIADSGLAGPVLGTHRRSWLGGRCGREYERSVSDLSGV